MKKQLLLLILLFTSTFIFSQSLNQPFQFNNVCDDNNDGFASFMMIEIGLEILANNQNLVVTHHLNQSDAASGTNPLPANYTNVSNPQLIFARIVNTVTGQVQITTYNLKVNPTPLAPAQTLTVCANNGATNCWDLTQVVPSILNGNPNLNVNFFQTQADAASHTNAIANPSCFVSFVTTPTIPPMYYRVEDTATGCFAVGMLQLVPVACATCEMPNGLAISQVTTNSAALSWITPNQSSFIEYYIGLPNTQPEPGTPPTGMAPTGINSVYMTGLTCNTSYVVYVRNVCSPTQNSGWVGPLNFFTTPCPNVPGLPDDLTACTDGPNFACFDLSVNTPNILGTLNPSAYTVSYYASQGDAANATNALSSPFCPSTPVFTIFARLQEIGGNYQIMTFTLTSNTTLLANTNLMGMSQCDDNSNGVIIYNLTDIQAQINTTNVLQYYLTAADAQNGINPIADPTAFPVGVTPTSVPIFVREIVVGGCDLIHSFLLQNSPNCNAAANCLAANSLCSSLGVPFANTTGVPQTGAAGCLGSTPNPTWFYIPVSTAGVINLLITQVNNTGGASDVDYIMYGPFTNPVTPCSNSALLAANITGCSYSAAAVETAVITNAQPGQYYLLMVTNFANQAGMITISQTNIGQPAGGSIACTGLRMNAFLDSNTNGIKDNGEQNFPLGQFHYEKNNNGTVHHIIAPTGVYDIYDTSTSNSYNVSYTVDAGYAASYNVLPASYSNLTVGAGMTSYYFPVTVVQAYNDLAVTVVPLTAPRPGFTYMEKISYTNFGNQLVASGTLTFTKDANVTITGNTQTGTVPTATGFTFNFTNLAPFETRTMTVTMQVPTIPTVAAGQLLTNVATIAPLTGDTIPENNTSSCAQVIINAYDPNDKMEAHGGRIMFSSFTPNDYLYYTIRFENTGTASAINVRVNDVLDAKLDETSLKMVSASHAYNLDRVGNTLNWRFDNIQLPVSVANTNIGKGYITFKIKPKPGYAVGDIINNAASIYFDFNPAIVTNVFSTQFVALGVNQYNSNDFVCYPNPTSGEVTVSLANNQDALSSIVVYDLLGKTIRSVKSNNTVTETIDLSDLNSGMYFIEVTTDTNLKMIKKLMVK